MTEKTERRFRFARLRVAYVLMSAALLGLIATIWVAVPPAVPVPRERSLVLSHVTIWTPGSAPLADRTITVRDGVIAEIRPARNGDARSICPGCVVMPGLIDAHVHAPPWFVLGNQRLFALLYLRYGVTTVRDLGQFDGSLMGLVRDIRKGVLPGPRIFPCGAILDGDPPAAPYSRVIRTAQDGREAVLQNAALGVKCIKVYDDLPPQALPAIAAEAAKQGLPLVGHVPHGVPLTDLRDFEIQHFTGVPYLERTPPPGLSFRSQDLSAMSDAEVGRVVAVMKERNLSILPTLDNFLARLIVFNRDRFPPTDGLAHMPAFWEKVWPGLVYYPPTEEAVQAELAAYPRMRDIIRRLHQAGVDVLAGSDALMPYVVPGESLQREIEQLADIFGSLEPALVAATVVNGRHVDPTGRLGRVAEGAYADLLVLPAHPLEDPDALDAWRFVVSDGRLHSRDGVEQALARYDAHYQGFGYRALMDAALSLVGPAPRDTSEDAL